jgi:hypothetical protein
MTTLGGDVVVGEIEQLALPRAVDSGVWKIGDVGIDCHVLDDGTRLITQGGVVRALTGAGTTNQAPLSRYIDRIHSKPEGFSVRPIPFALKGGGRGLGVTAEQFIQIIRLYVRASDAGELREDQKHIADQCRRIGDALLGVAIVALIDEVTGRDRRIKRDALSDKLRAYMLPEPGEWELHFPKELYSEFARVYRLEYDGGSAPRWGAGFAQKYVYEAIDAEVYAELKRVCPNPRFKNNLHQHLSPRAQMVLDEHIRRLLVVLRGSHGPSDFKMRFAREFRGGGLQLSFVVTGKTGTDGR